MSIPDIPRAKHYLTFISYYRLSGYFRYFVDPQKPKTERFHDDATFERVLDLYIFDRHLRTLILDALERIEVAVKASFSNAGSLNDGPFWICNADNFDRGKHEQIMKILSDAAAPEMEKQKHTFLAHFYKKYANPHPPSWMLMETLSFGAVSKLYKFAKGSHRKPVADHFSLQHDVMGSWLHTLVFARNVSAHHCRVWNRTFTIKPKIPKQYQDWPASSQDKLYVACSIIQHMMNVIADGSGWGQRFRKLIEERPNVPLRAMGFPDNWLDQKPWSE